ncbi:MAG: hypothetical protein KJP15_06320 [Gammaproteobacteria bacterium]|nr:hypothetical protein [Gammaproteobacteria bacterium]
MSYQNHNPATDVTTTALAERRVMHDRRLHSWCTLTYCGFQRRGRRRLARRNDCNYYLDWYDPRLVFTGIAVLLMSWLDALFTLTLLDRGAYEANYFMARLMETSDELFIAVKLAFTAFGIVILLMYSHFQIWRIISGKQLLQTVVTVYGLLISYELVLLTVMKG